MTRLVLGLAVLWGVAAQAEPWGVARGGGGQTTVLSRTDETGAALLGDADLPADAEEVVFTRPVDVASVSLSGRTLAFSAEGGATLTCVPGAKPAFMLSDGDWTFRNLALAGGEVGLRAPQFGGAVFARGGSLTLEGCSFSGFVARQTGGAVSAVLMDGDVTVTNCAFESNFAGPFNGDGGALYASAAERNGATLRILDSVFAGNEADNGGAVFTLSGSVYDEEEPIRVEIGAGTVLEGNFATYSGGALLAEGDALVTGPGTLFTGNGAGSDGGAVCLTGIGGSADSSALVVSNYVWFVDNATSHPNTWTSGGAVAAAAESRFERVGFTGNAARTESGAWSYGGAVSCSGGTAAFDTCVFDCAAAGSESCSGNAVDLGGTAASLRNCTFRRGVLEAVSVAGAAVAVTNCVLVGNGLAGGTAGDLYLESGASVSLSYCAYGAVEEEEGTSLSEEKCLAGRTTDIYAGETLYLDGTKAYNPVAAEGLVQERADFDGVPYGSRPEGYSMGAYECGTVQDDPRIRLDAAVWYHNRTDGLYYPRLDLTFLGGDASRIAGVTVTVDGEARPLSEDCVTRLRAATAGEELSFGVGDQFRQYPNSEERFGFVRPEDRVIAGVYEPERPPELSVTVSATLVIRPRTSFAAAARAARPLAAKAAEPLRFAEFRVADGRISGRVAGGSGGMAVLYGCAALGGGWTRVGALKPDAGGNFAAAVPAGLCFFRLDEEAAE